MPRVSDYWNESDSFNNPKESQRQIALPRRFFGIDLVHTVEFSRIGRSRLSPFPDCVEALVLFLASDAASSARREKETFSTAWLRETSDT